MNLNPRHWQTFGAPSYTLDNALQAQKPIDKWTERTRIGIYMGQSPQHACAVALILSITSGLMSPQYHVRIDNHFDTFKTAYEGEPVKSKWQEKCAPD